jgi:hypothetical protein
LEIFALLSPFSPLNRTQLTPKSQSSDLPKKELIKQKLRSILEDKADQNMYLAPDK